MKKFTKVLSVLLVLFVAVLTLTSCGSTTNNSEVIYSTEDVHEFVKDACADCGKQEADHCQFKDQNNDGICDECNKEQKDHCQYAPPCAICGKSEADHCKFNDEDKDDLCDVCNKKQDDHCQYVLLCGTCGKSEADHCQFKDLNNDGVCDVCEKEQKDHCQYVPSCVKCGKSEAYHFEVTENETFKLDFEVLNNIFEAKFDEDKSDPKNKYEDQSFVGLFDANKGILYLEEALVPMYEENAAGEKVHIEYQVVVEGEGLPTLDRADKKFFGPYFAGWYSTEELRNSEDHPNRLISIKEIRADEDHIVHGYYIDFVQAILVAVVCILIVFSILMILWGLVSLLKFIAPKQKEQPKQPEAPATPAAAPRQAISLADIKDEEMMAAALVATIDYHEETQEDVRVVSIKEIK